MCWWVLTAPSPYPARKGDRQAPTSAPASTQPRCHIPHLPTHRAGVGIRFAPNSALGASQTPPLLCMWSRNHLVGAHLGAPHPGGFAEYDGIRAVRLRYRKVRAIQKGASGVGGGFVKHDLLHFLEIRGSDGVGGKLEMASCRAASRHNAHLFRPIAVFAENHAAINGGRWEGHKGVTRAWLRLCSECGGEGAGLWRQHQRHWRRHLRRCY